MTIEKFRMNVSELGPIAKKAFDKLLDEGKLEKSGEDYIWTEEGKIEIAKFNFMLHNFFDKSVKK